VRILDGHGVATAYELARIRQATDRIQAAIAAIASGDYQELLIA
jgi:hypothetical protein